MSTYPAHSDNPPETFDRLRAIVNNMTGELTHSSAPADIRHDNTVRAGHASVALLAFADETMSGGDGETVETGIVDLIGDLLHLCDYLGLDFAECEEQARRHYGPELHGIL